MPTERLGNDLRILHRILRLAPVQPDLAVEHERVFREIIQLVRPDVACFYQFNDRDDRLEATTTYPSELWKKPFMHQFHTRDLTSGAIGAALSSRAATLITDPSLAAREGRYVPFAENIGSEIVVPIFTGQQLQGVLVLSRYREQPFHELDLQYSELAAEALALAYLNLEDKRARDQILRLLMTMSELNPEHIESALPKALQSIREFLSADFTTLWLYNPIDGSLVIRSFEPFWMNDRPVTFDDFSPKVLVLDQSPFKAVFTSPTPATIASRAQHNEDPELSVWNTGQLETRASFPIYTRDRRPYGILNVYYRRRSSDRRDEEQYRLASLLVSRIVDVFSLWLFSQRDSVVAKCNEVLREIDHFGESRALWDRLARLTAEQMQCEACSFFMEEHGSLVLKGTTGIVGSPPNHKVRYQPGRGLTGMAFAEQHAVIYYAEYHDRFRDFHTSTFREVLRTSEASRSILIVPIRDALNRTVGVIRCNNKDTSPTLHCGRFTSEDVEHLTLIGELAFHTVIRAAWLLEREKQQQSYLDRLHHEVVSPLDGILSHVDWLSRIMTGQLVLPGDRASELIQKRSDDVIAAARVIEMIVKSVGYEKLSEQLLLNSKPLHIYDMLLTCRAWLSSSAKVSGVDVQIGFIGGRRKVNGDRFRLMRVFYNLLINGIKYSDKNAATRYVRVNASERGNFFHLDFEDNGMGVPEEDVTRIFDRYFRSENAQRLYPQGSGLGLSYCRAIVEAHGGSVTLMHPSKPTIFRVSLPAIPPKGGD